MTKFLAHKQYHCLTLVSVNFIRLPLWMSVENVFQSAMSLLLTILLTRTRLLNYKSSRLYWLKMPVIQTKCIAKLLHPMNTWFFCIAVRFRSTYLGSRYVLQWLKYMHKWAVGIRLIESHLFWTMTSHDVHEQLVTFGSRPIIVSIISISF